jgi:hypothetical protein
MEEISSGDYSARHQKRSRCRKFVDTNEFLLLAAVFHSDIGLSLLGKNLEREVFEVRLHLSIVEFATDETLRIEDATQQEQIKNESSA